MRLQATLRLVFGPEGVGEGVDLAILVAEFVPHNVEGKDFGVRNAIERE